MLSGCYKKIMNKISYLQAEIYVLMKYAQGSLHSEDLQAGKITEALAEHMKAAAYELQYLSFPAIEGNIVSDKMHDQIELVCFERGRLRRWTFASGERIEISDHNGEWHLGKVKSVVRSKPPRFYLDKGSLGYKPIVDGMIGRIRKEA